MAKKELEKNNRFKLYKQFSHSKNEKKDKNGCIYVGEGVFEVDRNGMAFFITDENGITEKLHRTKMERASYVGIFLSGMELIGYNPNGTEKFGYQEWWLEYL